MHRQRAGETIERDRRKVPEERKQCPLSLYLKTCLPPTACQHPDGPICKGVEIGDLITTQLRLDCIATAGGCQKHSFLYLALAYIPWPNTNKTERKCGNAFWDIMTYVSLTIYLPDDTMSPQ